MMSFDEYMREELTDEKPHFETALAQLKNLELIVNIDKASMIESPAERRFAIEQIMSQLPSDNT
jgi:indole-3-glycerol phosphate synthase